MKLVFAIFAACFFYINSIHANDQQIADILHSEEFSNSIVQYQFGSEKYPVRVIHNPQKEILWGDQLVKPTAMPLIIIANLPFNVANHLKKVVVEEGFDQEFYKKSARLDDWDKIHPVYMN